MNAETLEALDNESRALLAARHLLTNYRRTGRRFYGQQAAAILESITADLQFLTSAVIEATSPPTGKPHHERKAGR